MGTAGKEQLEKGQAYRFPAASRSQPLPTTPEGTPPFRDPTSLLGELAPAQHAHRPAAGSTPRAPRAHEQLRSPAPNRWVFPSWHGVLPAGRAITRCKLGQL